MGGGRVILESRHLFGARYFSGSGVLVSSRRPPAPRGSRGGARPGNTGRPSGPGRSAKPAPNGKSGRAPAVERQAKQRPPRLFTIRVAMLFVILIFALITLLPTVRAYLTQRAEIAQLEQEVAAAEDREADLRAELARWEDPAYVAAQARERLAFVLPGETAYKVIDPDFVKPEEPIEADAEVHSGLPTLEDLVDVSATQPWYASVKDSIRVAGEN